MIRFDTGLASVPGAVADSVATPASTHEQEQQPQCEPRRHPDPAVPVALQAYIRAAIGMASRMNM